MTLIEIQRKISDGEIGDFTGLKKRFYWIAEFIYSLFSSVQAESVASVVSGVQAAVTVDMTNANSDMTYTAVAYGTTGNDISIVHVDPSANDAALAVSVDGTIITVSLATGVAGAITSTAAEVKAAVNAHAGASLLVLAEAEGTGVGVVNAAVSADLIGGINVTAGDVGTFKYKSDGSLLYIKTAEQVWKKATLASL